MYDARMVRLATVGSAFHARVIAARIGAEGILTELRGNVDGLYPSLGAVEVYVSEVDLPVAQELLLADEVESAFDECDDEPSIRPYELLLALVTILALTAVIMARWF